MPWPFPTTSNAGPSYNVPRIVRAAEPASEAVTAAEAKLWLRVDDSADDTLIAELIKAARGVYEELTGVVLMPTSLVIYWDGAPRVGTYAGAGLSRFLELPAFPLQSITSLKYLNEAGAETLISASDYTADPLALGAAFPRVRMNDSADWPTLGAFPAALRAYVVAGYADAASVPAEHKVAVKYLMAHIYQNRLPLNVGNIVNELPFTMRHLIEQKRPRSIA